MVQTQVRHALDPLSADEIAAATRILRAERDLPARHRIIQVSLREPPKEQALAGATLDREAFVLLLDRERGATWEAVVSLTQARVVSWEHIPDVQPPISMDEFDECEAICKASPEFQAALAKRGVHDMDLVMVDPWSAGSYEPSDGLRLVRALAWIRSAPDDNGYAHPIEGVLTLVDLNAGRVVRIEDHGVTPVPQADGNYIPKYVGALRPAPKPLDITQPEGPTFEVDGYAVRWQNWRLRIGFTPREGLVLHEVGWEHDGRVRPILYRAALSEMVVPYGDPAPTHRRKNAFDVGEYNIGLMTNSLELGCDCLGEIRYFDVALADNRGEPFTLRNAICLHEEDAGILWKHTDFRVGVPEVRRSRKLVVSFIATVGNYEYAFYWSFFQDGSMTYEIKMTGIVSTGVVPPGVTPTHGQLLNRDGLYAPIHQHFFNIRLDLDVDGGPNSLYEVHAEAEPAGPDNPLGNAFHSQATLLRSEAEAQQLVDPLRGRFWKVVNPTTVNAVGEPTGYRLLPHGNVASFVGPQASVAQRAGFMSKHLWATPYDPAEMFAAGNYPNQHPGGAGLPDWTRADRTIENTDIVLWYTLGAHHPVRLEDWPVMPVTTVGFTLQPHGFFDRSPALDVPPQHDGHCAS